METWSAVKIDHQHPLAKRCAFLRFGALETSKTRTPLGPYRFANANILGDILQVHAFPSRHHGARHAIAEQVH